MERGARRGTAPDRDGCSSRWSSALTYRQPCARREGTPAAAARELRRPQRLYEEVGADGHAERLAGELGQAG